jgi:hypothetical protein
MKSQALRAETQDSRRADPVLGLPTIRKRLLTEAKSTGRGSRFLETIATYLYSKGQANGLPGDNHRRFPLISLGRPTDKIS